MSNDRTVTMRVIAFPKDTAAVLNRVDQLCKQYAMNHTVLRQEPYWKMPEKFEMTLTFGDCPVWNYGKWGEVYRYLFGQMSTIEWNEGEDMRLFSYPPADSREMWVTLSIPSACFWPKPSKDIRHL